MTQTTQATTSLPPPAEAELGVTASMAAGDWVITGVIVFAVIVVLVNVAFWWRRARDPD